MALSSSSSQALNDDTCSIMESDLGIRLFGKIIQVPWATESGEIQDEDHTEFDEDSLSPRAVDEIGTCFGSSSGSDDDDNNPSFEAKDKPKLLEKIENENPSSAATQDEHKVPRKPEKPIPCPRCESLDTKFCYFNNYNVNQPRHFCKNCQRYWTAGGNLRNVPVGAGKRKSKHSNAQQRQTLFPHAVVYRRDDPGDATISACENRPSSSSPSTTLKSSSPFLAIKHQNQNQNLHILGGARGNQIDLQSMLKLSELNSQNLLSRSTIINCKPSSVEPDKSLCTSLAPVPLINSAKSSSDQTGSPQKCREQQISPVFGSPWPSSHNTCWTGIPESLAPSIFPTCSSAGADGFWQWPPLPGPFAAPMWTPQGWSFPRTLPLNTTTTTIPSANMTPVATLGKRPAQDSVDNSSLCIPKSLRIHDPQAAACSSILTTLSVATMPHQSLNSGGFFNVLQPETGSLKIKSDFKFDKEHLTLECTNPAARNRSHVFQESSWLVEDRAFLNDLKRCACSLWPFWSG